MLSKVSKVIFVVIKSYAADRVKDFRRRSDFNEEDPVYIKFLEYVKNESAGLPKNCLEDVIYFLCGNDHSPEHEYRIRKMKLSQVAIKMVIREKESFTFWMSKKETGTSD